MGANLHPEMRQEVIPLAEIVLPCDHKRETKAFDESLINCIDKAIFSHSDFVKFLRNVLRHLIMVKNYNGIFIFLEEKTVTSSYYKRR